MTNKVALISVVPAGTSLSKGNMSPWMQWLMTSHVRKYHRHYGSRGMCGRGDIKASSFRMTLIFSWSLRYIEGNPVRAAIVKSAQDWAWSSHRENAGIIPKELTSEIPLEMSPHWTAYVDNPLTDYDAEKLRECARRQAPYGDDVWQRRICMTHGLESTIRRRGRPSKGETR